jgi:PKD repeat protein
VPLIAIDMHGGCDEGLEELTLVLTDVGADPYGAPGNGGFNPRTMLDPVVPIGDFGDEGGANGVDFAFNGAWVYYDSGGGNTCENGNCDGDGFFNVPTSTGAGITFNGDTPMRPLPGYVPEWEYVPFPPGGGDPWWRIRLRFLGSRRHSNDCTGRLEYTPDYYDPPYVGPQPDFFVVIRPDSGYADSSTIVGDGEGMNLGADMRAFLEPLRWNPQTNNYNNGLIFTNQVGNVFGSAGTTGDYSHPGICPTPPPSELIGDLLGQFPEPFWYERTHGPDNVKPIRAGLEVHDLVMTYNSASYYGKFTSIQEVTGNFNIWVDAPLLLLPGLPDGIPPVGVRALRFNDFGFPEINGGSLQYAFETVPFRISPGDSLLGNAGTALPRDSFFPNPAPQPTLPTYTNWPPSDGIQAFGFQSNCYLSDEGTPNEPFNFGSSNGSEETYRDDEYAYVLTDLVGAVDGTFDGMWLIDREGGRFRINRQSGNTLFLENGHAAYADRNLLNGGTLDVTDYPFGVQQGPQFAVRRGAWLVVSDAILRNQYPAMEQWPNGTSRASRLLKQHIDVNSQPVAMLGINLASSEDPRVNNVGQISLNSITVAFWGPELTRTDLVKLDTAGAAFNSGVLLYEDTNGNGTFDGPIITSLATNPAFVDRIVPLEPNSLQWPLAPEAIDMDGDKIADDMSGDGVVYLGPGTVLTPEEQVLWDGLDDRAWVLRLQPDVKWVLPESDTERPDNFANAVNSGTPEVLPTAKSKDSWPEFWLTKPELLAIDAAAAQKEDDGVQKDFLPATLNEGDDLFVVVRASETIPQFAQFRAIIPSTLPERFTGTGGSGAAAQAGIEISPPTYPVVQSFVKSHPEEGINDFYGHDMLEASVPAKIVDLTSGLAIAALPNVPVIEPGGPPVAVLGVDLSANRPGNLIAQGAGTGNKETDEKADGSFITTGLVTNPAPAAEYYTGGAWTQEVIGFYLVALGSATGRYEAYEITGANTNTLTLRAGSPRDGSPWQILRDPSFLEEMIVEFYDTDGNTPALPARGDGKFDPQYDLLELNYEDPANGLLSGVSVYRDNDFHPSNRNGVFDPPVLDGDGAFVEYVDLPVLLDDPAHFTGVQGEPEYQVRMVFSSPGTDDIADGRDATPYETQRLLRQPIPQTFGRATADPDFGSDFFVVVRSSRRMTEGDNFSVGISSWGPDTPSEPDPDNFRVSNVPGVPQQQTGNAYNLFQEFPFGQRGLGLITFFREPRLSHFWGFDQDLRKVVARQERDTSQDNLDIRYWQRSNPNVFGLTTTITALPSPVVDFTADRNRQQPNEPIQFTLLATGSIVSVLWDFGDGTTSTERNPVKSYAAEGLYDVSVTVTDRFGIKDTEFKEDYIEILLAPFADFVGTPTSGTITPDLIGNLPPGMNVTFRNTSVGTDTLVPVAYFWNFGDGQSSTESGIPTDPSDPTSTDGLLVHRYTTAGVYTVSLQVTFRDTTSGQTVTSTCQLVNYITVLPCVGCPSEGEGEGEGEGEDPPAADFTIESEIDARDKHGIVPLMDWMPLFRFTMGYGEDAENVAPRFLRSLTYSLVPDSREPEDIGYINSGPPEITDILEFALFEENFQDDGDKDGTLDINDSLVYVWDNFARSPGGSAMGTIISGFPLTYSMNFLGNGTPQEPQFPIAAGPTGDNTIDGRSYVIAVRSSATWRSQLTMGVQVLSADMIRPEDGSFPVNDEGEPIDSYSPNFFDAEIFEEEVFYGSSFTVFDTTGGPFAGDEINDFGDLNLSVVPNLWSNPFFVYTPAAEHTRPRWSSPATLLELFTGEILQMRELLPVESWQSVIGINLHSGKPVHDFGDPLSPSQRNVTFEDYVLLDEVNVVLTDIGADPLGEPGNGGFDPREALERVTDENYGLEPVVNRDFVYNGVWVFWDSNGNGKFDPPVQDAAGGVRYKDADRPMGPGAFFDDDTIGNGAWEYVPFPPGGGDPWWKIKLRIAGFASKFSDEGEDPLGWVEPTPDQASGDSDSFSYSEVTFDYFVVVRTDSGFKDISTLPGDGNGIKAGADFRAFIEPRRFNALTGSYDGGIHVDSMIPPVGPRAPLAGERPWQDDTRWGTVEPWWPERTASPESAKPLRSGIEVHDLTLVYESDSSYRTVSDLFFGASPFALGTCLGFSVGLDEPTDFERWVDPFGQRQQQFLNRHTVGVFQIRPEGRFFRPLAILTSADSQLTAEDFILQFSFDGATSLGQYAFETTPFFNNRAVQGDVPPSGPRSGVYPLPPAQPALPDFITWPATLAPGDYPRLSDWAPEDRRARLLTQKIDTESTHTPVLGFNLAGANDVAINGTDPIRLANMTIAFWGPNFTPADLMALDAAGRDKKSGILLWEDADQDGTFFDGDLVATYEDSVIAVGGLDRIVPLRNLIWADAPELIDLDGDGTPDDMNGDGLVDDQDKAWTVSIEPENLWELPHNDFFATTAQGFEVVLGLPGCPTLIFNKDADAEDSFDFIKEMQPFSESKALDPAGNHPGDDLFLTVRTSDQLQRFEKFRAVVPASLPQRASEATRKAGIQFFPQVASSEGAFVKTSPEEDAVQDFYGHDMVDVNVPTKLVDMTNASQTITIGGPAVAGLGIDASTNRPDGTREQGAGGVGAERSFTVDGKTWPANRFTGDWLVDSGYETYEITGNNANQLQLLSGKPRDGIWRIVQDPSFLEQVIVELYNEGQNNDFNPTTDLLPLHFDQRVSGLAIYRDNDNDPRNSNGLFDPDIDIPLTLDAPPVFVGQSGEDIQVKFVFSSPGTDDISGGINGNGLTRAEQPRNRQWIPDSFGRRTSDVDAGPEFFVVVRGSQSMSRDDNFRMGIVSWGPNTPTEPDPDTWSALNEPQRNEFSKFQEFPWGARGVGYITHFKNPPVSYGMDESTARQYVDSSGYDFIRSHTNKKRRTGIVTARVEPDSPSSIRIDVANPKQQLPSQTLPGESFTVVLRGKGFGTKPTVAISGYDVKVVSATDTAITLELSTRADTPPQEPIVVIVRNPDTGREVNRNDVFSLSPGNPQGGLKISGVNPGNANEKGFPITISGKDFPDIGVLDVYFGGTRMPIQSASATTIVVGFPAGGMPTVGRMDVIVKNVSNNTSDTLVNGFTFENEPDKAGPGFLGCAPAPGGKTGSAAGDAAILLLALLALSAGLYRRKDSGAVR